jgi:hypothetical protein
MQERGPMIGNGVGWLVGHWFPASNRVPRPTDRGNQPNSRLPGGEFTRIPPPLATLSTPDRLRPARSGPASLEQLLNRRSETVATVVPTFRFPFHSHAQSFGLAPERS